MAYNISDDNETTSKLSENERIQGAEKTSIRLLQQAISNTESSAESSNIRNQNENNPGQLSISSPYIHLSTCYAGKVKPIYKSIGMYYWWLILKPCQIVQI